MEVLVSNIEFDGNYTDPKLINPYGILTKGFHIWVSSVTSSLVSKYKCTGELVGSIDVPSPTGMCFGKDNDVYVASNTGVIYLLNTKNNTATTYITIARSPTSVGGIAYHKHKLYVAVFSFGYVQVYDTKNVMTTQMQQQTPGIINSVNTTMDTSPKEVTALVDKQLADFGYVPVNVSVICKTLYITYGDGNITPGFGYVNSYDIKCGSFSRLINRGVATYPYGMDSYKDQLYVANGSGYINIYSMYGDLIKTLEMNSEGQKFYSDGLRSISIHNNKLYYVSANNTGKMGSLGVVSLSSSCSGKTK